MWVFLVQEIMFFGGMFLVYTVYRDQYYRRLRGVQPPPRLEARRRQHRRADLQQPHHGPGGPRRRAGPAESRRRSGSCSRSCWARLPRRQGRRVHATSSSTTSSRARTSCAGRSGPRAQDRRRRRRGHAQLYFSLYFAHDRPARAAHDHRHSDPGRASPGRAWRGAYGPTYHTPVEMTGLYWHFVDIVWIFLFPLLYLIGHH